MTEKLPATKEKPLIPRLVRGSSRAGVGAGAALIGLALFLLFRGFGFGPGDGSGEGTGGNQNTGEESESGDSRILAANADSSAASESPGESPESNDSQRTNGLSRDEEKAISGNVLTVLIDEHDYLMQIPGTTDVVYRRCELPRLIELAKLTKGDTNGIRVRILRRESARASSESQIKIDLAHAGITADAVVMPQEFVP